jgi:hypothetical protein
MKRVVDEGSSPKDTVALGGDTYRSRGLLNVVIPGYITRSGTVSTLLLVDRGWLYADRWSADRAWGLINTPVTVTWRLAYGRRYVTTFDGAVAKGETGTL